VKRETECDAIRVELSARLDGEVDRTTSSALDSHLETCAGCREHEEALRSARRAVRLYPAPEVPDLTSTILQRVQREGGRQRLRDLWSFRVRVAAIAAAASALLLIGSSLPFTSDDPEVATAAEIARQIRRAAQSLRAYSASFDIVERGWHPQVPVRRFRAHVTYEAPESASLSVFDNTSYPEDGDWPHNNVYLIARADKWWFIEPTTCPTAALPGCAAGVGIERRGVVHRQPFDGATPLPTDIVVPLETVAGAGVLEVIGADRVLGHSVQVVELPYRRAIPLIDALQAGGSWRAFHPFDRVRIAIDEHTWFPLAFEVTAVASQDRERWANRLGYEDEPGATLLSVTATAFSAADNHPNATFRPPPNSSLPLKADVRSGGFRPRNFFTVAREGLSVPEGLAPYRAGVTPQGRVYTYVRGMTWLKVVARTVHLRGTSFPLTAEEVRLQDGGVAYYEPATDEAARRLDLYLGRSRDRALHLHIESNLARADLLQVARSVSGDAIRLPRRIETSGGFAVVRIDPAGVPRPPYLPAGYRPAAALRTSRTVTVYFRATETEYDGFGIRITRTRGMRTLPPSSRQYDVIALGDGTARWSPETGELEWIEGATYRSVAVPSFGLEVAVRIAESL
jgi:hypothetical protein